MNTLLARFGSQMRFAAAIGIAVSSLMFVRESRALTADEDCGMEPSACQAICESEISGYGGVWDEPNCYIDYDIQEECVNSSPGGQEVFCVFNYQLEGDTWITADGHTAYESQDKYCPLLSFGICTSCCEQESASCGGSDDFDAEWGDCAVGGNG